MASASGSPHGPAGSVCTATSAPAVVCRVMRWAGSRPLYVATSTRTTSASSTTALDLQQPQHASPAGCEQTDTTPASTSIAASYVQCRFMCAKAMYMAGSSTALISRLISGRNSESSAYKMTNATSAPAPTERKTHTCTAIALLHERTSHAREPMRSSPGTSAANGTTSLPTGAMLTVLSKPLCRLSGWQAVAAPTTITVPACSATVCSCSILEEA
mmetsp:Transcript_115987/g.323036  ORF Transcript_115987/g.323036 Transcript_115987/m.323036 type:complete len:216 (+) Transcript_115987:187-834(+)